MFDSGLRHLGTQYLCGFPGSALLKVSKKVSKREKEDPRSDCNIAKNMISEL